MNRESVVEAVPPAFVARMIGKKLPNAAGVPLIKPVPALTLNPSGKAVALNAVGTLVAAI